MCCYFYLEVKVWVFISICSTEKRTYLPACEHNRSMTNTQEWRAKKRGGSRGGREGVGELCTTLLQLHFHWWPHGCKSESRPFHTSFFFLLTFTFQHCTYYWQEATVIIFYGLVISFWQVWQVSPEGVWLQMFWICNKKYEIKLILSNWQSNKSQCRTSCSQTT